MSSKFQRTESIISDSAILQEENKMAAEQITVHLAGGTPWGFRLIGGGDGDPLMVAKVRQRSKADTGGLREDDVLLGLNNVSCKTMSHGTAMGMVDNAGQSLTILVLRGSTESHVVSEVFRQLEGVLQSASAQPSTHAPPAANLRNLTPFKNPSSTCSPSVDMMGTMAMNGGGHSASPRGGHAASPAGGNAASPAPQSYVPPSQYVPPTQQYKAPPMFHVSNLAGAKPKPGTWTPSGTVHQQTGLTVSAPSGVNVQSNADRSITMSFGLDNAASKENQPPMNVAPPPNMFKVNKVETSSSTTTTWKPKASGSAFTPTAFNYENQQAVAETNKLPDQPSDSLFHQYKQGYMDTDDLPALAPDVKVFDLTRILKGEHADDSGPDSPGFLQRSKQKMYADSAFYDDPEHKYPTIEEQIKMARNVAKSLLAPANKRARGHTMFVKRRERSDKWVAGQKNRPHDHHSEDDEEKYYRPDPWSNTHTWQPPTAPLPMTSPPAPPTAAWDPAPASWQPPSMSDSEQPPTSVSANEFEKMRLFDKKSTHDQVSPAMCFSLADDLRKMKGRGGALFAKKRANAEQWAIDEQVDTPKPNANLMQKILLENAASQPPEAPQAAPSMAGPSSYNGSANPSNAASGPRLHAMIEQSQQACTPWDAALTNEGDIDAAFDHLNSGPSVYSQLKSSSYGILPRKDVSTGAFAGKTKPVGTISGTPPAWSRGSYGQPPPIEPTPIQLPRSGIKQEAAKPWSVQNCNSKPVGFKPVNFNAPKMGTEPIQPMVTCGDDGFSDL